MNTVPSRFSGFTLIELLLVIGLTIVLAVTALIYFGGSRSSTELDATAKIAVSFLRESQSRSVSQASSSAWGVHFENSTSTAPFFSLFAGSYSSSTAISMYRLPASVFYTSSTLAAGGALNILFSTSTGGASVSSSIGFIFRQSSSTRIISVASSGVISF